MSKPRPLKRLRDLQWPNEPDPSLWDDPLNQHEVKPLRNQEYEAIGLLFCSACVWLNADVSRAATSPELRALMAKKPELCNLLKSIFASTSSETPEQKLLSLLGMSEITPHVQKLSSRGSSSRGSQRGRGQARGRGRGARGGQQQSFQQQGQPDKDEKALMEEFSATINSILKETRSNTVPT